MEAGQKVKQWFQDPDSSGAVRWILEPDGEFSTRSAYKALINIREQEELNRVGEQADKRTAKFFWKVVWRANVQPKVKLFAWRLFHDYMPSAVNLIKRGVREIGKCPVCGMKGETTVHTILECWWAQLFWKRLNLECRFLDYRFEEPGDWLWFCVFNYDALEVNMILQGARAIWFNRNSMLKGNNGQSPITTAKYVYQQAWNLHCGSQKLVVTDLSEGTSWLKPRKGEVKINVDGAWDSSTKRAGVGISCRDEWGCFSFVEAYPLEEVASCVQAEQEALVKAMLIAEEENLSKVTFETDNVQLMNAIMKGATYGDLGVEKINLCKDMLGVNKAWFLNLISREANVCADMLAKKAKKDSWRWSNRGAVPLCLSSVLNNSSP